MDFTTCKTVRTNLGGSVALLTASRGCCAAILEGSARVRSCGFYAIVVRDTGVCEGRPGVRLRGKFAKNQNGSTPDGTVSPMSPDDQACILNIEGAWNVRDAGGQVAAGGAKVKRGVLFRSDALAHLSRGGQQALLALGLRTVCDLRMPNERKASPDRIPAAGRIRDVHVPLCPAVNMDPAPIQRVWGLLSGRYSLGNAEQIVAESYRYIVRTQAKELGRVLRLLSDPENLPILIHCQAGKDRTGLVVACIHLLLGVSEEDMLKDYLLTNAQVAKHRRRLLRMLRIMTLGRFSEAQLAPLLEARQENLLGGLRVMTEMSGSLERYLLKNAAMSTESITKLRQNLLE
jgi:protein-tyrosine phosphatase